jgi:hypothetical protein
MGKRKEEAKAKTYMVLGVDQDGIGKVSIVINAEDDDAAKRAYRRRFPKYQPISWPCLEDLHESVRLLELARDGVPIGRDDVEVLDAGDSAPGRPPKMNPNLFVEGIGCPNVVLNALYAIRNAAVERGLEDPFGNNGSEISTPAFDAKAYRWEPPMRGGFWWRDIHISWYKHVERDCRMSRHLSLIEIEEMQDECLAAIVLMEKEEV